MRRDTRPTRRTIRFASMGLATLALAFLVSGAAAAQKVRYDFDTSVDFSKYHTYRWVELEGVDRLDQLTDKNIRTAIDSELATKGLTRSDAETVDLWVAYQVSVSQEQQIHSYGYGGYGYGWRAGMGSMTSTTSTINVGTLVLDMYDPVVKQLIWRGIATKTLNPSKDPEKNRRKIEKVVDKLLKNYPPPPPKR